MFEFWFIYLLFASLGFLFIWWSGRKYRKDDE